MKRILAWCMALGMMILGATSALAYAPDEVVGEVAELLQGTNDPGSELSGTTLGYAAADAVARAAGTELAIVNGGDIAQNLQGGEATWADICAVFTEDRALAVTAVTPAQLKQILEVACSHIVTGEDDAIVPDESKFAGFVQPSGFTYECDGSAAPGDRILEITLTSTGEELDLTDETTTYTLAASEYLLSGGYDMPTFESEPLDLTLAEALAQSIAAGTLEASSKSRVSIVGTTDDRLIDKFPIGLIILAAVLIGMFNYKKNTRYDYTRYNYRNEEGYERKKYIRN